MGANRRPCSIRWGSATAPTARSPTLDGLNLSRAWCWREIASSLDAGDPRHPIALEAARIHLDAALPHVTGDYMGEHWLASFALLALLAVDDLGADQP